METVQALYATWNVGAMNAVRELLDHDVVLWNPKDFPEPGPFIGPEAVMRQWEQQRETFQADTLEPITDPVHAADHVR
jgi:ketosteroid isomerase-like protein